MSPSKAVVLLSGGVDSTTSAAIARAEGFEVYALTFDYGQRHRIEIDRARLVGRQLGVRDHAVVTIDLRAFGGSALTSDIAVPKHRSVDEIGGGIPLTYVPARNTIFLSFALAWAEVLGSHDIFMGVNALDYSGYPDCRPEYIAAYQRMADLATRVGVEGGPRLTIHTPLIALTKAEIIQRGLALGVDYSLTTSCYDPSPTGVACGACDSCLLRLKGFSASGVADANARVKAGMSPLIESWQSTVEAHRTEMQNIYSQMSNQSAEHHRSRLENVSNQWMLATVASPENSTPPAPPTSGASTISSRW